MTIVMMVSCGTDKPVEHGLEYVLTAPEGTDTATITQVKSILEARLKKFDISESDFDVYVEGTTIKVHVTEDATRDNIKLRQLLCSSAQLTFRAMYAVPEIGDAINEAQETWVRMNQIDSVSAQTAGLRRYLIAAYDPQSPGYGAMSVIAYCYPKDTGAVNSILGTDSIASLFPGDMKFMWGTGIETATGESTLALLACKVGKNHEVSGSHVTDASVEINQTSATAQVNIQFDQSGTTEWAKLTRENIGRGLAIEMDGFVYSYPTVNSEITGGQASITGPEPENMKTIASMLNGGELPVRLTLTSENTF